MAKRYRYLVLVEKAKNNYSAYAPDLPGCITTGRTPEETLKNMKGAISLHLYWILLYNYYIPPASHVAADFVEVDIEG